MCIVCGKRSCPYVVTDVCSAHCDAIRLGHKPADAKRKAGYE